MTKATKRRDRRGRRGTRVTLKAEGAQRQVGELSEGVTRQQRAVGGANIGGGDEAGR